MWKEFLRRLTDECEFCAPASLGDLLVAEGLLQLTLPDEIKTLLCESNGVFGEYEAGLIWPLERIIERNFDAWNDSYFKLQHPHNSLLFFADAGNGDLFGFAVSSGQVVPSDVCVWDHEDSSIQHIANSLQEYLEKWVTGNLKI